MVIELKKIILYLLLILIGSNITSISAIGTYGRSAILLDADSNRVLYEKNKDERLLTASIAKIMTAIIAIENIDVKEEVLITYEDSIQVGSSVYLKEGDKLRIIDLLHGLLLRSGNDCAHALAMSVSNSLEDFSILMNEKAKELGMINSTFENPSGLDENTKNYSTAYDMALLTSYAIDNPIFRKIFTSTSYKVTINEEKTLYWKNKHRLVTSNNNIIGGKTGYTETAGRTLVSYAVKDGKNLIAVTFDDGNDWNDHTSMFEYGFNNFTKYTAFSTGKSKSLIEDTDYYLVSKVDHNVLLSEKEITNIKYVINDKDNEYCEISLYYHNRYITTFTLHKVYTNKINAVGKDLSEVYND